MALVLPFLVLLAFGLVETGMGWRNAITVTSAARQGARVSSHLGVNPQADREGLLAVQAVMGAEMDQVDFIVFYKANGSGALPPGCEGGSIGGVCNWYDQTAIGNLGNDAAWGCSGYDSAWCGEGAGGSGRTTSELRTTLASISHSSMSISPVFSPAPPPSSSVRQS